MNRERRVTNLMMNTAVHRKDTLSLLERRIHLDEVAKNERVLEKTATMEE
jgi:hypothetical protein